MKNIIFGGIFLLTFEFIAAQTIPENNELKKTFNESGTHYIKATILGQFWSRYTDMNQGTTLDGFALKSATDFGIRRLRFSAWTQLSDRVFFYVQFGQNNFNYTSKLNVGSFFHDAVGEFKVHPKLLTLGSGLTGWSGLARYASPSVGTILSLDAPLYQQVTNGITDQFLRKLSVYAKGKIGKLDYRLILSNPMSASNSLFPLGTLNQNAATFSLKPPKLQNQGYFNYQFLDQEDNTLAYTVGSYLGAKKILNIGAGWIHQNNAMWILNSAGDTLNQQMLLLGTDIFTEIPLSEKKNTISAYVAFTDYQMGKNYLRNLGVMNPANGVNSQGTNNGAGNAFPIIGTGQTLFTQLAYKFKDELFKTLGTIQLYGNFQYSHYQALKDPMTMYEGGLNWFVSGNHKSKISLGFQSRPVFTSDTNADLKETSRKGMAVLQYQISL